VRGQRGSLIHLESVGSRGMVAVGNGLPRSPSLEQAGLSPRHCPEPSPCVEAPACGQAVLGSEEGDSGGMLPGLVVLALHLTQPRDCILPCSDLKGEHGHDMDKGCSEQGLHGFPGPPLLPSTCRGLWLRG